MIQYQQTINKDFSTQEPVEEPIIGYQPRFRPKESEVEETPVTVEKPVVETTETVVENKPVSQEQPPGEETVQKSTSTKSKKYTDRNEFVKDLTEAYTKALKARGIDTAYAKMLVAQDALESGWGKHYAGNYNFGNIIIPAGSTESYTEGRDHDAQGNIITQKFRNYSSLDEWVNAKIDLLSKNRYQAFTGDSSPSAFYDRIKRGGYAVDKEYVDKMLRVYNSPIFAKKGTKIPSRFDKLVERINFAKLGTKLPKFQQGKLLPVDTRGERVDANEIGLRQAFMENNFSTKGRSPKGAVGLFQIMPVTLADYLRANSKETINLDDPIDNQKVRDWKINQDITSDIFTKGEPSDSVLWAKTLAAYNYGRRNTINSLNKAKRDGKDIYQSLDWLEYLPKETKDYVNFILRRKDINQHKNNEKYNRAKEDVNLSFKDPLPKKTLGTDPTYIYIQNELNKQINPDH